MSRFLSYSIGTSASGVCVKTYLANKADSDSDGKGPEMMKVGKKCLFSFVFSVSPTPKI